jgi:hypothetical protein
LLGLAFFETHNSLELPEAERFWELPLAAAEAADTSLAFALREALCFSSMTCLMASRLFRRALGFLGSMKCIMFYWFTQEDGTKFNTIPARSASSNGISIFLVPATAINESKTIGR